MKRTQSVIDAFNSLHEAVTADRGDKIPRKLGDAYTATSEWLARIGRIETLRDDIDALLAELALLKLQPYLDAVKKMPAKKRQGAAKIFLSTHWQDSWDEQRSTNKHFKVGIAEIRNSLPADGQPADDSTIHLFRTARMVEKLSHQRALAAAIRKSITAQNLN